MEVSQMNDFEYEMNEESKHRIDCNDYLCIGCKREFNEENCYYE